MTFIPLWSYASYWYIWLLKLILDKHKQNVHWMTWGNYLLSAKGSRTIYDALYRDALFWILINIMTSLIRRCFHQLNIARILTALFLLYFMTIFNYFYVYTLLKIHHKIKNITSWFVILNDFSWIILIGVQWRRRWQSTSNRDTILRWGSRITSQV